MAQYVFVDVTSQEGGAIVASGTQSTVVFGPWRVDRRPTKSFVVRNLGSVTLSGIEIQYNPDQRGTNIGIGTNPNDQGTAVGPKDAGLWATYAQMGSFDVAQQKMLVANDLMVWTRGIATHSSPTSVMVSGWMLASSI